MSEPQCDRPYSANWIVSRSYKEAIECSCTYLADTLETLGGGNVPLATLCNLGEDPGLDERTARDHDAVDTRTLLLLVVALGREAVAVAKDGDGGETLVLARVAEDVDARTDVRPVGELGVALLARAAVELVG